ncbi:hypothetical protein BDZ90DRAFT_120355 [Jaminaea rosea]|uniref:Uncharacterized protein n=1 Tax=Jaminaea rosea TaxID=1569628 RepID=A0A316UXW7_9BASI|nr:hypothetical protein BDZ90DRAFT_120355 [Jaminaea rosea]PWN29834.1 hypothetical protein BDZ90DRAFT_120355 [Jaminaea rosea]
MRRRERGKVALAAADLVQTPFQRILEQSPLTHLPLLPFHANRTRAERLTATVSRSPRRTGTLRSRVSTPSSSATSDTPSTEPRRPSVRAVPLLGLLRRGRMVLAVR